VVEAEPVDSGKSLLPDYKNDPKFPHRFPLNLRFEADGDVGGKLVGGKPTGIVLHHTMSYNTDGTVNHFKNNVVDVHFLVGHKGEVVQMADCDRACAHAGASKWGGLNGLNSHFIGIEVVNIGPLVHTTEGFLDGYNVEKKKKGKPFKYWKGEVREREVMGYKYWEPFTAAQEQAIINLCGWAMKTYGISIDNICGHYECSPGRKNDPAGGLSFGSVAAFREHLKGLFQ
jgi:N-acetylmuramoyl-L-alanine amidase